jgi:hypothetical protein
MARKKTKPPTERVYAFRDDVLSIFPNYRNADPNVIGRALWDIAAANNGRLETDTAIEAARNRAHPLHPHLTWDDKIAGHNWRAQEMRTIIRAVRLVGPGDSAEREYRRGWLSVDDRNGVSYHYVDEVLGSRDLQLSVMRRALRDLKAWEDRYRELEDICELVTTARTALESRLASQGGATTTNVAQL